MSLLIDIATSSLDPSYAEAAARRAGHPRRGSCSARRALALVAVLAAALLVVVAGVQAHRHAPAASRSRQALVDQVHGETAAVSALQRRLDVLRDQTTTLRDQALASSTAGGALGRRLDTEELLAGTVAATGPGLRIVLDDAPAGPGSGNRVLDRDLQSVVNAVWAAGAEAVAVGDQRLTGQSAIRQAGAAITVNFQPVSPPYVVVALGAPVSLETSFGASPAAARMRTYAQIYGLRFHYTRSGSLQVPPAPGLTLRYARPVTPGRTGSRR